jgi:hypothetical protein
LVRIGAVKKDEEEEEDEDDEWEEREGVCLGVASRNVVTKPIFTEGFLRATRNKALTSRNKA